MSYQYLSERERTALAVNFDIAVRLPVTEAGNAIVDTTPPSTFPHQIIGFNEARSCKHPERFGVHFFLDDYQFERLWRTPDRYVNLLRKFPLVLGPDFSLYTDYPEPLQRWNHYRNQLLTAYYQSRGIPIVPAVGWAGEASYEWCFDGIPQHGTLAISTVGCLVHKQATQDFLRGLQAALAATRPTQLVVYGSTTVSINAALEQAGCQLVRYPHGQAVRMGRAKPEEV